MENNEGRGKTTATTAIEKDDRKEATAVSSSSESVILSEKELNERVHRDLMSLGDIIDSPQEQLILRNIILTLLELTEEFTIKRAYDLVSEDQAKGRVIELLSQGTPQYWSSDWNLLWKKDEEPLLSFSQQRATSRARLVTFWQSEWTTISLEIRNHVAGALKAMMSEKERE